MAERLRTAGRAAAHPHHSIDDFGAHDVERRAPFENAPGVDVHVIFRDDDRFPDSRTP